MIENMHCITQANGIMAVKNLDSVYLNVNKQTAKLLGWNSIEECIGKTDYDIPCEAAKFANQFIEQDKKVFLSKKNLVTLDIQLYKIGWKILLSNRSLFNDESKSCAGLVTQCIDISDTILSRYYFSLFQLDSKIVGAPHKGGTYILNSDHCSLPLTKKQETCLFFLVRGKTIKQIANALRISPRTVEDHVNAIKNKLHCQTKQDIIEKAIDSGFLYYFPNSLYKDYIKN